MGRLACAGAALADNQDCYPLFTRQRDAASSVKVPAGEPLSQMIYGTVDGML